MCDTYNYDNQKDSTFRFENFIDFQLYIDFPFQFCVFYPKITPSVTQRSVSQENAYKKS